MSNESEQSVTHAPGKEIVVPDSPTKSKQGLGIPGPSSPNKVNSASSSSSSSTSHKRRRTGLHNRGFTYNEDFIVRPSENNEEWGWYPSLVAWAVLQQNTPPLPYPSQKKNAPALPSLPCAMEQAVAALYGWVDREARYTQRTAGDIDLLSLATDNRFKKLETESARIPNICRQVNIEQNMQRETMINNQSHLYDMEKRFHYMCESMRNTELTQDKLLNLFSGLESKIDALSTELEETRELLKISDTEIAVANNRANEAENRAIMAEQIARSAMNKVMEAKENAGKTPVIEIEDDPEEDPEEDPVENPEEAPDKGEESRISSTGSNY